ncbi:MAG TPA: hypothetical protein VG738_12160 [Chitinophagaceae bacterium]|nr:hypothetical protein [Chitinophagaceae bacterium]
MSVSTENNILQFIAGKQTAGDITVDELAVISAQYPSFGVLKYLLAKKAQAESNEHFIEYAQSAIVHFSNPYWFHFKLNEESLVTASGLQQPVSAVAPEEQEEILVQDATQEPLGGAMPEIPSEHTFEAEVAAELQSWKPGLEELIIDSVGQDNETSSQTSEAPGQAAEPNTGEAGISPEVEEDEHPEDMSEVTTAETMDPPLAEDTYHEVFEDGDAENEALITELPGFTAKISSVLQEQLDEFKKPVSEETPLPIEPEPYHTVDYFASQGIKLTLEQQKQDNLGVKVKKFTDWLKQMKRVNPAPADLGIDEAAEHKVQDIAAGSNEPKDIVTETMAEVLAMQGMTEKAIQVYIKLSFLDPSKTAYFASKIEKLKGL